MKIDFSFYILNPTTKLNNFSEVKPREGILLRVDEKYYLDYHPWQEFGDLSCEDFLTTVRKKGLPDYMIQLLQLEKNRDLIVHQNFKNHSLNALYVKLKVMDDLKRLAGIVNDLDPSKKYRLDFNNRYSLYEIKEFWENLNDFNKTKIDYLEDPCPNTDDCWQELYQINIPLACDRNDKQSLYYQIEVFKPNCEIFNKNSRPMIFSSYMGHDLGRYHAYLSLCQFGDLNLYHGINTPGIYQEQIAIFDDVSGMTTINEGLLVKMYHKIKEEKWTSL